MLQVAVAPASGVGSQSLCLFQLGVDPFSYLLGPLQQDANIVGVAGSFR